MYGAVDLSPRKPQHSLQIHVPRGYESGDVRIVGVCHVCEAVFGEGEEQAWQEHCGKCARAHIDEIRAAAPSEKNKGTIWDDSELDPEVGEHMLAVGRRMLRDGDFEVHPHERAGLS